MSRLKQLIVEIHHRSLWQVLGIYLAGSWLVLQLADTFTASVGLPDWVPQFSLVILVILLPVVLATAFVQEGVGGREREVRVRAPGEPGEETDPPEPREVRAHHRLFTWRNSMLAGVGALAILGLGTAGWMTMRTLGIGPAGTLMAKGLIEEGELVILADFDSADSVLAKTITEALRIDLAGTSAITLLSRDELTAAMRRMERASGSPMSFDIARELAIREGVKGVIHGSINVAGEGYVLTAELVAAEDGGVLIPLRETASDPDEVIPAIDRLSGRLRERVGESLRSVQGRDRLESITTGSLPALQKWVQADHLYTATGDYRTAIQLLQEAVALDSTFAYAYRKLGGIYMNHSNVLDRNERLEYMTKAMQYRSRLSAAERHSVEGVYHSTVTFDDQAAAQAYSRQLAAVDSSSSLGLTALNNLAMTYRRMRKWEEAERVYDRLRSLEPDSRSWMLFDGLLTAKHALGKTDEAIATLEHAITVNADSARWDDRRIRFLLDDGDFDAAHAAITEYERRYADDPDLSLDALWWRSTIARLRGRLGEAAAGLREERDSLAERGSVRWYLTGTASLALLVADRGDPDRGVRMIHEALLRYPLDSMPANNRPYLTLAAALARLGRPAEARAFTEAWTREVDRDVVDPRGYGTLYADGWLALHDGQPLEAVRMFRSRDRGYQCPMCALDEIGLAYDRAGMADSAIAVYERYITTPWLFRFASDAPVKGFILERLGHLYDERAGPGDLEDAAKYYAMFVELWADADEELQPRVRAAQARLEEIVRERG